MAITQQPLPQDPDGEKMKGAITTMEEDLEDIHVPCPETISRYNIARGCEGRSLRAWIMVLACVSFCFFGYDQGMTAGVNASNDYVKLMGYGYVDENNEPQVTDGLLEGGIVAIYYFGALLGCLLGGWAGDKYGRIWGVAFGSVWGIVGAALQCSAMNVPWMCMSRLINGVGTGILNAVVPVWATEVADHSSRGQMIAIEFSSNIFGVVIAYWLAYGLSFIDHGNAQIRWRFPIAFQILPLIVLLMVVWFFPESPRWLVKDGRHAEAKWILTRLRGNNGRETITEYNEIVESFDDEVKFIQKNGPTNYWTMISGTGKGGMHITRRTYLIIWLQIIQEWVGVAGVTVYAPVIFRNAGMTAQKANLISGINNITYTISTFIPIFILDKYGRRTILYWGAVLQAIAMAVAGFCSKANDAGSGQGYGIAATIAVFAFTFFFGATWLCVPWVYQTEIFPLEIRVKGASFGVIGWAIGNGWLTLLCPIMFQSIGPYTLVVFAACSILTIPQVWALYPETNDRKLEDIEYLFNIASPWNWDAEKNYKQKMAEKMAARAAGELEATTLKTGEIAQALRQVASKEE